MKYSKLLAAAGFAVAATGAFANTGVNTADRGYVANVNGRASIPAVMIAGPVVTRPSNVDVAGREAVQGTTQMVVTTREVDVNKVFGRA